MLYSIETHNVHQASQYECWIKSMHEELNQIEKNHTWNLDPRPQNKNAIGTKWVFKDKLNEDGKVVRNKIFLVYKRYS